VDVFSATAEIQKILSGLSNKEATQALTMVAALKNLRVISMDRPIGQSAPSAPGPTPAKAKKEKGQNKTAPSSWKLTQEWKAAEEIHQGIVAQIKSEKDSTIVESLRSHLREQEETMKALKQKLRGSPSA
jgi:hypothetical protein